MGYIFKNVLLALVGFILSIAANVILLNSWYDWSQSSWADCPNYAFSQTWYPEPPPPVTVIPFAIAIPGIVFFAIKLLSSKRNKQPIHSLIHSSGLALSCLPFMIALIIPIISELLHLSKAGC